MRKPPKLTIDIRIWDPKLDLPQEATLCSERCAGCQKVLGGVMKQFDFYRLVDYHRVFECPVKGQKPSLGVT